MSRGLGNHMHQNEAYSDYGRHVVYGALHLYPVLTPPSPQVLPMLWSSAGYPFVSVLGQNALQREITIVIIMYY